jgi:hypothetical protein
VTATVYPPLDTPAVEPADLTRLAQMQRELEFHPEQHINFDLHPTARPWVEQKQHAIENGAQGLSRKEKHRLIAAANAALREFVADEQTRLVRQTDEMERALWIKRQLHVREYAFCLFSDNFLRPLLLDQTLNTA